jgi:hypothetical protein
MTAQLYVVRQLSSNLVPVLRSHQTKSSMIIQLHVIRSLSAIIQHSQ